MHPDHLQSVRTEPETIRRCISQALRDMMAWRTGGGSAPASGHFVAAALAALHTEPIANANARRRVGARVQEAARRFFHSALAARLLKVETRNILHVSKDPACADVVVRDPRGHVHAIAITAAATALAASDQAALVAQALPGSGIECLTPATVHLYSIALGKRFEFDRSHHPRSIRAA